MTKRSMSRQGRILTWLLVPVALVGIALVAAAGAASGYLSGEGIKRITDWLGASAEHAPSDDEPLPVATEIPLFDEWPAEKPAVVLAISGEMLGYMRPCGCSEGMSGGLARRAGLFQYLRDEKGWNPLAIDLGDLVKAESPWDEARYRYVVESLKALGYRVLGIGTHDLSIKAMTVAGEALNSEPLQMVSANVKSTQDDFNIAVGEFILPLKVVEMDGQKVAVGSLIGDALQSEIRDQNIELDPSTEAAQKILDQMNEASATLKVLLAHLSKEDAVKLAEAMPGFDLIICRSELERATNSDATTVGDTLVTWVGQKGMELGVVGYWPTGNPRLRFEVVPVDPRFKEGEELNEIYARFVTMLWDEEYLAKMPKVAHPSGADYIGSARCAHCHPRAFDKWKESKHSHALQTLEDAKPEGQHYNPECVRCHVVGQGYQSGFVTPDKSLDLGGVGCENCHGPGSKHAIDPNDATGRSMMRVSKNANDCIKCHDADNSVHFNFETYWPKIDHPWRN